MAKNDEITLIIAKSFSKQQLTEKEKEICCNLTISELVNNHGLNDIQSKHVMQWCAMQKANIAYEGKEHLLSEGLFDKLFKNKSKNKYNEIVKKYITSANKNEDVEHISLFLRKVAAVTTFIEKRGLSTFEKKANVPKEKGLNNLLNRALDVENSNSRLSAQSESLKNLKEIADFIKGMHDAINTDKPKITSAKKSFKENRELSSYANKPRRKIDQALLTLKLYTKRPVFEGPDKKKRAANALIKTISRQSNIKSAKEIKELTKEVKKYFGDIYKQLNIIYNAEKQSTIDKTI